MELQMGDDAIDHGIVCNESDDLHPAAAFGTDQRVGFIEAPGRERCAPDVEDCRLLPWQRE